MEQLFNDLQQQIAGKMGEVITLIDEDSDNWKHSLTERISIR